MDMGDQMYDSDLPQPPQDNNQVNNNNNNNVCSAVFNARYKSENYK